MEKVTRVPPVSGSRTWQYLLAGVGPTRPLGDVDRCASTAPSLPRHGSRIAIDTPKTARRSRSIEASSGRTSPERAARAAVECPLPVACQGDGTTWLPAAWDHLKLCVSIIAGLLGGQVHVVVVVVVAGMTGLR